jgi:hypothetical protein
MATGNSGEGPARPRVALQRARPSASRQLRNARNLAVNVVAPVVPEGAQEPRQRRVSRVRQARTVKQLRAQDALFRPIDIDIDIDIDIVIKMALRANARRSQFRQLSVLRRPSLPVGREVLAQLPVVKVDVARVAQGRQLSAAKVSARSAGTRK